MAIYWSGLESERYADDFKFVFGSPLEQTFHFFTNANPNAVVYRPIEAMILCYLQAGFGLSTPPIHILILSSHILLSWLTFLFMRTGSLSLSTSIAGGLFMLASQANAFAVLSNDTFSQVGGTLLGCAAVWMFWKSLVDGKRYQYFLSIAAFVFSLFMKETSLGYLACVVVVAAYAEPRKAISKLTLRVLPYVFITTLYLLIRASIVTGQPDSRYAMEFGFNMVKNLALLLAAAIVPFSQVDVYLALHDENLFVLVCIVAMTVGVLAIILYGLVQSEKRKEVLLLLCVALASLTPMMLISHVSELYVYNAMPMFSVLFGIGIVSAYEKSGSPFRRRALIAIMSFISLSHVFAINGKAGLMKENGRKAGVLLADIREHISQVPPGCTVVLANPNSSQPEYSIYLVNDFDVFKYGTNIFNLISNRNDFTVWVIDMEELRVHPPPTGAIVLTIENNSVETLMVK